MRVKVCQSLIEPREVKVASSSGPLTYTVVPSTIWNDGVCDCKGFEFRGDCKHLRDVEANACDFVEQDYTGNECPDCRSPIAEIELEPEFDTRSEYPRHNGPLNGMG